MSYIEDFIVLKQSFNHKEKRIELPEFDLEILNIPFESENYKILPGENIYKCNLHNKKFITESPKEKDTMPAELEKLVKIDDSKIYENRYFSYPVVRKIGTGSSKNAILLFHGLNEKSWNKYLPWAKKLVELTGKAIILFPMAFHMNRAPADWSNPGFMRRVAIEKKKLFTRTLHSSVANAAISTRLQFMPVRFLWSGLQSYYDVIQLIRLIRNGKYSFMEKECKIDMFAYSIGSFLAEILLMSNPEDLFTVSKLFNFCGGPVLTRSSPVSKYILDSEANISVYTFFIDYLDSEIRNNDRLSHYFSKSHPEGEVFRSMLDYQKKKDFREARFKELSKQIVALGLKKDKVIPPFEIINTLKGEERLIPVKVKILDFMYNYDHVVPFPVNWNIEKEVDRAFTKVFKFVAKFLK